VTSTPVQLPWPLAVVPSAKALEQLQWQPGRLVEELTELSAQGQLPARIDEERAGLRLYTRRHVAVLFPTNQRDAYRLGYVQVRRFRDEDQLVQAALLLHCPHGWRAFPDLRTLPRPDGFGPGYRSQWEQLTAAWKTVAAPPRPAPALPARHGEYLDLVTELIDAGSAIELDRQRAAPPTPYSAVTTVREKRFSGRGVYQFDLARPGELAARTLVRVNDDRAFQGQVVHADAHHVVVRFDDAVDFGQIPPQGRLHVRGSTSVYQTQTRAVTTLRDGRGANPTLLATLVDGVFAPYEPDGTAQPSRTLHDRQQEALARALAVPDVLLVQGPPGTGKTTTINEIVVACTRRQQRVLITSHTNRAVDNILDSLSPHVQAVRVGAEDQMTATARTRSVDSLVERTRQAILGDHALFDQLTSFTGRDRPVLEEWRDHLARRLASAEDARVRAAAAAAALADAAGDLDPALARELRRATADRDRRRAAEERLRARIAGAHERIARGEPATGLLRRWRDAWLRRRITRLSAAARATREALAQADDLIGELRARLGALAADHPVFAGLVTERERQQAVLTEALRDADTARQVLAEALRASVPELPAPAAPDPAATVNGELTTAWEPFQRWVSEVLAAASARAGLLAEWRARIGDAEAELRPELVRYAEVVAATCIGSAHKDLVGDEPFDLAIVDEAGQVSTPNLLVPLVRARRAVLVGDHMQLPPFLDEEVRGWADRRAAAGELSPDRVRMMSDLLRASGFEQLFQAAGPANRVRLVRQHRMPAEVAGFVSAAFYDGQLVTAHAGGHADPVFRSPFALVDTSDRRPDQRRERSATGTEATSRAGYVNELEASLIATLVGTLPYRDWAVIVPYRAQAARIVALLAAGLGDPTAVADNVGTVDSFQGGERDLIVYGFTRSNSAGAVGFLSELRRLNVAVSRPKRQLVLVGDLATLRAARDTGFATMTATLIDHVAQYGDLRGSTEIERLLRGRP
jgi:hypothetical protein